MKINIDFLYKFTYKFILISIYCRLSNGPISYNQKSQ